MPTELQSPRDWTEVWFQLNWSSEKMPTDTKTEARVNTAPLFHLTSGPATRSYILSPGDHGVFL